MKAASLYLIATLLLLITSMPMAQQPAAVTIANRGPERDPNMPYDMVGKPVFPTDWPVPIYWTADPDLTIPYIYFKLPSGGDGAAGVYLGFNESGSWLHNKIDGKTYIWNLKTHTATVGGGKIEDLPTSVLASLRNSAVLGVLARRGVSVAGPEADPNMPHTDTPHGGLVSWGYIMPESTLPTVNVGNFEATYLGFNERGTWMESLWDGKLYLWNGATQTVIEAAKTRFDVPLDLKNQSLTMQGIVAHLRAHPGDKGTKVSSSKHPEADPNLADDKATHDTTPFAYDYAEGAGTVPAILIRGTAGTGVYLGFNERGSWVKSIWDGNTYVWNAGQKHLELGATSDRDLPAKLKNPSPALDSLIARAAVRSPDTVAKEQAAAVVAHTSGDAYGSSTRINGSKVTIVGGVLKFTLDDPESPDHGKQVIYKVTRSNGPAMPMGAPNTSSGIAGTWIADDPRTKDGVVMFIVKDDNTIVGTVFHGLAAQAMKTMATSGH